MARTRYQYGEIVIKRGRAHDSYMGRWKKDFGCLMAQSFAESVPECWASLDG